MSQVIISIPEDEFWQKLEAIVRRHIQSIAPKKPTNHRTYSINGAARLLHRNHGTIAKMVKARMISVTPEGRIPQSEVDRLSLLRPEQKYSEFVGERPEGR